MFQETLIPVASKSSAFTTDWIIFALVEIIPTQLVGNGYIDLKIKCEKEGQWSEKQINSAILGRI